MLFFSAKILLVICLATKRVRPEEFTSEALSQLRYDIRNLISDNSLGLLYDHPLTTIYDFLFLDFNPSDPNNWVLIASIVRLVFHDCAGTSNPGLCDGCIDLDNSDNFGLYEGAIDPLSDICDYYNDRYDLSYADCWALSATFAIELSSENNDQVWNNWLPIVSPNPPSQLFFQGDIPYYIGRKDCDTTPDREEYGGSDILPEAQNGWPLNREYFFSRFSMTNKEIVAIIAGGHSLGRAHIRASGYASQWDNTPGVIDNDFHHQLILPIDRLGFDSIYTQGKVIDSSDDLELSSLAIPQFHLPQVPEELFPGSGLTNDKFALMLNADMSLYYNLSYYTTRNLHNEIDCQTQAILVCAEQFPGSIVPYPGETQDDYPNSTLCPFIQCPINCEGGENELYYHISNNFTDIDDNANCPAAFLYQGLVDEFEFADSFKSAFIKMITAGYKIKKNNNGKGNKAALVEIKLD